MPSLVLQTAIGLIFLFAVTAAAVSAVTEGVSRFVGLRAEFLLRGIRTMVDGQSTFALSWRKVVPKMLGGFDQRPSRKARKAAQAAQDRPAARATDAGQATDAAQGAGGAGAGGGTGTGKAPARVAQIMSHPLVASSATQAEPPVRAGDSKLGSADRRRLPSYIAGPTFARALIDILVHDPAVAGGGGQASQDPLTRLRDWAGQNASSDPLAKALRPLLAAAQDNMQAFEASVASWYDDHMGRVSGWYKRHVRWISLVIGLILVLLFNVNTIRIADSLYSNQAVQGSVVTVATQKTSCKGADPAACLADLQAKVGQFSAFGLPVGWGDLPACATRGCTWLDRHGLANINRNGIDDVWAFLLVLLGWALTVAALTPGARFWFDLLSRLGSLRSTGPKPPAST